MGRASEVSALLCIPSLRARLLASPQTRTGLHDASRRLVAACVRLCVFFWDAERSEERMLFCLLVCGKTRYKIHVVSRLQSYRKNICLGTDGWICVYMYRLCPCMYGDVNL
jgi:hypothetical protein